MPTSEQIDFDVFISYAHDDSADVAKPLTHLLRNLGLSVWMDETQMVLGDEISLRVETALRRSRCGVVILSPQYLGRSWPLREMSMLLARDPAKTRVLPVLHGIDEARVRSQLPALANRFSVSTSEGLELVALRIQDAVSRLCTTSDVQGSTSDVTIAPQPPYDTRRLNMGGTVGPDAVYVDRSADDELWNALHKRAGIATLIGPRGIGKSSLLHRLATKASSRRRIVRADLTTLASHHLSASEWLLALANEVATAIDKLPPDAFSFHNLDDARAVFNAFLEGVAVETLLIIDEGDVLRADVETDVLTSLAESVAHQRRTGKGAVYIAFASTSSRAQDLVTLKHSELGYHIILPLFTPAECRQLFQLAHVDISDAQLETVMEWTGGYPFLVQWSADALSRADSLPAFYHRAVERNDIYLLRWSCSNLTEPEIAALRQVERGRRVEDASIRSMLDRGILIRRGNRVGFTSRLHRESFLAGYGDHPRLWLSKVWKRLRIGPE